MSQVVVATFHVREGQEAAARAALAGLAEQTRAEAGCLTFALHEDPRDPRTLVMVERRTSEVDFHQPYVDAMLARADELPASPHEVRPLAAIPGGDPTKGAR